jgi:hypothetical protein
MTRHREAARLYWDSRTFRDEKAMIARLGRENAKDNALDYRPQRPLPPNKINEQTKPAEKPASIILPRPPIHSAMQTVASKPRWKVPTLDLRPPGFPKPLYVKPPPEPRPVRPAVLPRPAPPKPMEQTQSAKAAPQLNTVHAKKAEKPKEVVAAPPIVSGEGSAPRKSDLRPEQQRALKALEASRRRTVKSRDRGRGRELD